MNPWKLLEGGVSRRRLGKLTEEVGELLKIAARIGVQGLDEHDPETGEHNLSAFSKELADVQAQVELCVEHFKIDAVAFSHRVNEKKLQMAIWEDLLADGTGRLRIGTLVRYGSGSTALMRIETAHEHADGRFRYYGSQCMDGVTGAWDKDVSQPSPEDIETWKKYQPNKRFVRWGE